MIVSLPSLYSNRRYDTLSCERGFADQAFARAAGAPLIPDNCVTLLRDAAENYPAWLDAIEGAVQTVHFESYIIHDDECGGRFAEALAAKAQSGVRVRVLYDWMGALTVTSRGFWQRLREAGVEVRRFNPPQLRSPLGWLSRDHRKTLVVDGRRGFVSGLCVGQMWVGDPRRGLGPWRDTGVAISGPAVAALARAFAQTWAAAGSPLPETDLPRAEDLPRTGKTKLRVIASAPSMTGLYRLDKIVAAWAQHSLWITDAYFIGTAAYVQALIAAAHDGVDVRLLVPGSSDLLFVRALSRAGYRPLLEGGVRVFEWNGPMLHAKTAVADGQWARVGSTNLNPASWLGNWELDVAVEDAPFAQAMEAMFLQDLEHATEIVLGARQRVQSTQFPQPRPKRGRRSPGSAGRAMAGALGIGNVVGAAITNRRVLGPAEAKLMATGGLAFLLLMVVTIFWPVLVTFPLTLFGGWLALALFLRAYKLHVEGKKNTRPVQPLRKPLSPT
jgi:cardiolipin synthase